MKILWPYDPFAKSNKLHIFGKNLISKLFDEKDELEAIYIASNSEVELATAFNIPDEKRYSDYPKKLIVEQFKKLSSKNINIVVLAEKSLSLTAAVKKVVGYSKKKNSNIIVIASNAKNVLPIFIFGSFAESLVHLSVCDLLIFHQKTKLSSFPPSNIIYAHDFSEIGALGLERVTEYVKKWNTLLTIVHIPIPEVGMGMKDFNESTQKYSQKIEKILKRHKINYNLQLASGVKPIAETLLEIAEKTEGNIIAITAQSDKLTAFLGGSITRQVLRKSSLPTLVLKV